MANTRSQQRRRCGRLFRSLDQRHISYQIWYEKSHPWRPHRAQLLHFYDFFRSVGRCFIGWGTSLRTPLGNFRNDRAGLCIGGFTNTSSGLPNIVHEHVLRKNTAVYPI